MHHSNAINGIIVLPKEFEEARDIIERELQNAGKGQEIWELRRKWEDLADGLTDNEESMWALNRRYYILADDIQDMQWERVIIKWHLEELDNKEEAGYDDDDLEGWSSE